MNPQEENYFEGGQKNKEKEDLNEDRATDRSTIKVGELENHHEYKCRICLGLG